MARRLTQADTQAWVDYLRRKEDKIPVPHAYTTNALLGKGEGTASAGAGVVRKLTNILDQTKSASTTALLYATDKDDETRFLEGYWKGLKGDVHTSTSDILSENFGVKNRAVLGAAGLAGDILLDPATYTRFPRRPGMLAGEAEIRAGQQLEGLVSRGEMSLDEAAAALPATTKAVQKANRPGFKVELGAPFFKTRTVAEISDPLVVDKLRDIIRGPEGNERAIVKAFSRKAEQPYGFAERARRREAEYTGDMEEIQRRIKNFHSEVSPGTRHAAALAFEDAEEMARVGDTPVVSSRLGGGPSPLLDSIGVVTIRDYVEKVREHIADLRRAEYNLGMHRADLPYEEHVRMVDGERVTSKRQKEWYELDQNEQEALVRAGITRLPKHVEKPEVLEIVKGINRGMGRTGQTHFNANDLFFSEIPERARPVVDIAHSHQLRLADSMRNQSKAMITHDVLQELGQSTQSEAGRELLRQVSINPDNHIRWSDVQLEGGKSALLNEVAQHAAYAHTVIPDQVAKLLNHQEQVLTRPELAAQLVRMADATMGRWKAINTVLSPGYFIRTAFGDFMQNTADGVWNPWRYWDAEMAIRASRKNELIDWAETVKPHTEREIRAFPQQAQPGEKTINIGGRAVPATEVYQTGLDSGIASGDIVTERQRGSIIGVDREGIANFGQNPNDPGGMLKQFNIMETLRHPVKSGIDPLAAKMSDVNIAREVRLRLAHFIDRYDREVTDGLRQYARKNHIGSRDLKAIRAHMGDAGVLKLEKKAAETAGRRVRQFNIDYGGLSSVEKEYMRRFIPFYTFFRKNAPLQLSMMATNPGFMSMIPKGITALQNFIGTNEGDGDWLIPDWIRESLPVRLAVAGEKGNIINQMARFVAGETDDTSVFLNLFPSFAPMGDIETVLGPVNRAVETGSLREGLSLAGSNAMNMTAPFVKMPAEIGMNRSFYSGAPIKDYKEWLANNLGGSWARVGYPSVGGGERAVAPAWSSFALGPKPWGVDQASQRSEYQRRKDITDRLIKTMREEEYQRRRATGAPKWQEVDKESNRYKRITNKDIKDLQRYMKYVGRSVGATQGRRASITPPTR